MASTGLRGGNLNTFARRVTALAKGLEENFGTLKEDVTAGIHVALVLGTPVDKGDARSNWLISKNYDRSDTVPATDEVGAIHRARADIKDANAGPEDDLRINNNKEYIGLLNDGSSTQAPAGFFRAAVLAGAKIVANRRLLKVRGL